MAQLPVDLARRRAAAQWLTGVHAAAPDALVTWMGAMQAQDYPFARWAIAQRLGHDVAAVEEAIARGTILRTHVLRPTWHFVPRDDLRWMQALTASRVLAVMRRNDARNGLDADLIARGTRAIAAAIGSRGHLTRREIGRVLAGTAITADPWAVGQLLMHAELRAVVCSGAPREGHQTYALVEERVPRARQLSGDEALAELARRYFRSHGPATARDFRWWSGLDAAAAARGIAALGRVLERVACGGRTYLMTSAQAPPRPRGIAAHLFHTFDEIVVAYSESRDLVDARCVSGASGLGLLLRGLLVDGQLAGRWSLDANRALRVDPLRRLSAAEQVAVDRARTRFGRAFPVRP